MMLALLKGGGCWNLMAKILRFMTCAVEILITRFKRFRSLMVFEKLLTSLAEQWFTTNLREEKKTFVQFRHAMYATDVNFQYCNRPSGSTQK